MLVKLEKWNFVLACVDASDIKFGCEKMFLKELWLQCEIFSGKYKHRSGDEESFCLQERFVKDSQSIAGRILAD